MATTAARRRYLSTENGKKVHLAGCKRWRAANPDKMRASYRKHDLKRYYDMTVEQWDALFIAQGSCCAACGAKEPGRASGQWATDHDHKTKTVRGILCNGCNIALGQAKDDPNRLRMLAEYLEKGGTHHARFKA